MGNPQTSAERKSTVSRTGAWGLSGIFVKSIPPLGGAHGLGFFFRSLATENVSSGLNSVQNSTVFSGMDFCCSGILRSIFSGFYLQILLGATIYTGQK